MKLLLDNCISVIAAAELRAAGHDVAFVADWQSDPGDERILEIAYEQRRVLITLDKDFGELAVVRHMPHAGIVWLVEQDADRQSALSDRVLRTHGDLLAGGAIVTVGSRERVRVRPPEREL